MAVRALSAFFALAALASAENTVRFPTQDGGMVHGVVYGTGERGLVLAHGGRFNKESWATQAETFAESGFRVLAFDFRGYGKSRGGPDDGRHFDVLAAVRYLRETGAKTVFVIGASMGGDHAAEASEASPEAIDRLILLAAGAYTPLTRTKGRKLFIMTRNDVIGDNEPRMPQIRKQYLRAAAPKDFVILDGSAHAQAIFATEQGGRLTQELMRFLSAP